MNLIKCVNAYFAVRSLMEKELDYQTAWAVVSLRKQLHEPVRFYREQETRLVREYAARDEKGEIIWDDGGRFVFQDPQQAGEYERRRRELGMVEVERPFRACRVPRPERIRPAVLEALEGFLVFGEEENL